MRLDGALDAGSAPRLYDSSRRPPRAIEEARALWAYRNLVVEMAIRDIKIRYKRSVLGVFWTMLWYAVVGIVIGGLGRLFVSGRRDIGLAATALYGIAGALLGGVIANDWLDLGWFGQFLTAVAVAAVLVAVTVPRTGRTSP